MKIKKRWVAGALLAFGSLVFLAAQSSAQVANGKRFEFSTSASVWNMEWKGGATQTIINLPVRFGFYAYKGLEFEPELFLTVLDETDHTGFMAFGNIAFNLPLSPNFLGFLLGGVGVGNGLQTSNMAIDQDQGVFGFNFGTGLKGMIGNSAALRIEYRVISYSMEGDHLRTDQNILVGVSIFF